MLNHACIPGINTTWHTFCFIPFRFVKTYFWLRWVFAAALAPPLVVMWRLLLLRRTGTRLLKAPAAAAARRLSCSVARGALLDQGSNVYPLHWQVDSQSLDHQKSPPLPFSWSNLPIYFSLLSQLHPSSFSDFMLFFFQCKLDPLMINVHLLFMCVSM